MGYVTVGRGLLEAPRKIPQMMPRVTWPLPPAKNCSLPHYHRQRTFFPRAHAPAMASYDSDSSEGDFTETNVLLGYTSKETDGDVISRLGGRPV